MPHPSRPVGQSAVLGPSAVTHAVLRLLREQYAFDATPMFDDLGVYHVPFESMCDGVPVETQLRVGALRGERIALIADSGCGKSSVISFVLGPMAEGVYPVLVPVHSLMQDAASPGRIADAVISQLARDVHLVLNSNSDALHTSGSRREVTQSGGRLRRLGVRAPAGTLRAEVAEEIGRQITTTQQIELPEKIEVIYQGLRPLHEDSLMPVFVFDDSDRWSAPQEEGIVEGFFTEAIRWLTDLPAAVVVAMHSHYLNSGRGGSKLLAFLDTKVELPRLPAAAQLGRILLERARIHVENEGSLGAPPELTEIVTDSALRVLFDQYDSGKSLRQVLQLAHHALAEATDAGAEALEDHHIVAAIRA